MISDGGKMWRRVPFRDPTARLLAVAANRGVIVIAGWRLIHGTARLTLWSSRTGTAWQRIGGIATATAGAFVDIVPDGRRFTAVSLEGTPRGLRTAVWSGDARRWRSDAILGLGEARAICIGPHGATAVAVTGQATAERVVAWHRGRSGTWSSDPEIVASAADASRCAEAEAGTVVAGTDNRNGAATVWRAGSDASWNPSPVANTAPRTVLNDVMRDAGGFAMTGTSGARGQADLAVWRSTDGVTWTSAGGTDPVFLEPGYQAGLALARFSGQLIVVGRSGAGDGGIWIGS